MAIFLKSIELSGFKSFCNKSRIEFVDGITGIVGPNGSGKSNVVEAVKWVLGEQSAKSLRGSKMEDVIFNGSRDRNSLGMADVNLTFNNENHWLPLDFNDVSVARRIFRSGEGQYYVNRSRVRLKDVLEMFLDTGVGKDSYAIFEQGKIDRLLSESPMERRTLFEDFAGISKFKFRKDEAERKLNHSKDNLERVNDVIIELEKELVSLKSQAEDANKYHELRGQLRTLEMKFEALRVRNLTDQIQKRDDKKQELEKKLIPLSEDLKNKEDAILISDEDISNREKEFSDTNYQLNEMEKMFAETRSRLNAGKERKESLQKQLTSMELRLKDEEARSVNLQKELKDKERDFSIVEEEKTDIQGRLDKIQAAINAIYDKMKALDEKTLATSKEMGFNRIVSKDNIERKRQDMITTQAALSNHRSSLEEKWTAFRNLEAEKKSSEKKAETIHKENEEVKQQLDVYVKEIDKSIQKEKDIREQNREYGKEIKSLQVELKSMDKIIMDSLEKQSVELKGFSARKPLMEAKIESALEKLTRALDENRAPDETRKAINEVRSLFQDYRSYYENILGILYSDEGTYTRKENIQTQIEDLTEKISANEHVLEELRQKLLSLQGTRADYQNQYNRHEYDLNNTKKEIQKLDSQINQSQESMKALENQINTKSEKIKKQQTLIETMSSVVEEYDKEIMGLRDEKNTESEKLHDKKVDFVRIEEQYKSLNNEIKRIKHQIQDIERMKESYASDKSENLEIIDSLAVRIEDDTKKIDDLKKKIQEYKTKTEEKQKEISGLKNNRKIMENQTRDYYHRIQKIEAEISEKERIISEKQGNLKTTLENVRTTYNIDIRDIKIEETDNIDEISKETTNIRRQLTRLGEVNMLAIEQYQEAEERMSFLQTQKADIEKAMEDIIALIDETNQKSVAQFVSAFEDIRKAFKKIFARLFDGGKADLILSDKSEPLTSGIEILAEPPGKKFQNISLLSGGERALVAIAVIFAILYLKPTPFVVLDELDAPLDDDNIERFKKMLIDFKPSCQFILVSHSKSTLEICDALYGVTMEEQGVSKIINVAFDEANMLFKEDDINE